MTVGNVRPAAIELAPVPVGAVEAADAASVSPIPSKLSCGRKGEVCDG
jgi:hypothetical protein